MSAETPEPGRQPDSTPEGIVASKELTRQQKIDRLREMSYDARELDVAKEEGMGGGEPSEYDRIVRALRALGAEDAPTDQKQ